MRLRNETAPLLFYFSATARGTIVRRADNRESMFIQYTTPDDGVKRPTLPKMGALREVCVDVGAVK